MSLLVDTSAVIGYLRQHQSALDFIAGFAGRPHLSVATVVELYVGARSQREEQSIEALLSHPKFGW